ncbi:hypothetical protein HAX54_048276, partial [Datura stramonium]|nr:hypothetical protein [Datura stramonium]
GVLRQLLGYHGAIDPNLAESKGVAKLDKMNVWGFKVDSSEWAFAQCYMGRLIGPQMRQQSSATDLTP